MVLIKKVWLNKANGQKLVTIPKDSIIKEGDHVSIVKAEVTFEHE